MERREFCKYLGICGIAVCSGSLSGCARLLEWSEGRRGVVASRTMAPSASPGSSGPASATAEPTVAPVPAQPAPPDLAVRRGGTPEANTRAAIAALGGMQRFVRAGARVAIKPNMLTARAPEYAATTNPDVVATLVTLALEAGAADVVVFDRPTAPARQVYEVSGIAAAVQSAGGRMKVLADRDFERVAIPEGRLLDSWPLAVDAFEADVFINVPIAKTHGLAVLTMAMKNLMGLMGGARATIHQDFHQKIVDINSLVKPHLVVLDATRVLTANGPSGGNLADVREDRTVIAGTSQVSVDAYGTSLFNMRPEDLRYLTVAAEQGLGVTDLARMRIDEAET